VVLCPVNRGTVSFLLTDDDDETTRRRATSDDALLARIHFRPSSLSVVSPPVTLPLYLSPVLAAGLFFALLFFVVVFDRRVVCCDGRGVALPAVTLCC